MVQNASHVHAHVHNPVSKFPMLGVNAITQVELSESEAIKPQKGLQVLK